MNEFLSSVKEKVNDLSGDIIYIHSDISKSSLEISQNFNIPLRNRNLILEKHYEIIKYISGNLNIWMPSFNYEYCQSRIFRPEKDRSEVGLLSDFFRKEKAKWRYPMPVFSFSGTGDYPNLGNSKILNPFNLDSLFGYLHKNNSIVMFYGANIFSNTIIHYAEEISGKLVYRYDKFFPGKILLESKIKDVEFKFHVRPLGAELEYDYQKVQQELIENNILFSFKYNSIEILLGRVDKMVDYYLSVIDRDKFYLLTKESKERLKSIYEYLGRPFKISDFE